MIVDGHAYSFPPLDSAGGYSDPAVKMRAVQRELGGHHQPVWRVPDRAAADNDTLVDQETGEFRDVEWGRDLGRLAWTYEGETYTKQYVPPMMHNLEFPPETLIAEMDYAGVDVAVLHNAPHLGRLNRYLGEACQRFPDRLMRLITLPFADVPNDVDAAVRQVADEVDRGVRSGFQFFTRYYWDGAPAQPWDQGPMRSFWDAVTGFGMPMYFTLQAREGMRYTTAERQFYMDEQRTLERWMERYPDATVVVTHGLQWRTYLEGDRIVLPEEIWDLFASPRCHLQLLFPIQVGNIWEYPWAPVESTVREIVDRVGSDRLIFGTDMPMVARFCTYRQTIDQFRVHCDFLTDVDRENILGRTAARVMGITYKE